MFLYKDRYTKLFWFDGIHWTLYANDIEMYVIDKMKYTTILYYEGKTYIGMDDPSNTPIAYQLSLQDLETYGYNIDKLTQTLRNMRLHDLLNKD